MSLQRMLDEFVHHNIDVACTMIETAGRFLFLLPETHERMNNMAQVSVRPLWSGVQGRPAWPVMSPLLQASGAV